MRMKTLHLIACLIVIFVAFWLRIADLKNIPPGIYYDEGRKLQREWRLTQGYGLPLYFQDIPEPFDVLIRATYLELTGGVKLFMAQMFSIWLNLLTVAAVIAAARTLYPKHRYRNLIGVVAGLTLATMPPAAIIGRHIYRANWLPLMSTLALISLMWCWRRNRLRDFALAGILIGLSTIFYLAGLFFPPAIVLVLATVFVLSRFRWPKFKSLLIMGLSFGIVMLPWLYFYFRIPNWLVRVGDLTENDTPFRNLSLLVTNIGVVVTSLFIPDTSHDMRYNTFTTAFLNPALFVLFMIGLGVTLWRWRRPWSLTPLLIGLVMLWPDILTNEPQPVRLVGLFAPLSLIVGLGAGEALTFAAAKSLFLRRFMQTALVLVCLVTPIYTAYNIWYHFNVQPLLTNPNIPESFALKYRIGFKDLLENIADSDQPTYLPIEYLNTDLAVAVLRPYAFPTVHAYDGRSLPAGKIIMPVNSIIYGFFLLDHTPVQYALLLPKSGEILILPPLSPVNADKLEHQVRMNGDDYTNQAGWVLGQSISVTDENNPFKDIHSVTGDVMAVFDDNLELLGIDAPDKLTPGENIPVTLYWRLKTGTRKDYFSRLQTWDYSDSSEGYEHGSPLIKEPDFPLNILYYIYPTVMWQPGEIVADTRWLPVFKDAPSGGYRFAVSVYDYPGPTPVNTRPVGGIAQQKDIWILVGRSAVSRSSFVASVPPEDVTPFEADLGNFVELTGYWTNYSLNALKPGDVLSVRLDWRVLHPTGENYTLFLHLTDASGKLVAQEDAQAFNGQFPTWAWSDHELIPTWHQLVVPADASGPFMLGIGMYSYPSLQRLITRQNGVRTADDIIYLNTYP